MNIRQVISMLLSAAVMSCSCSLPVSTACASSETKLIALTFDDGPNTYTTPKVLDLLEAYDAKASFFLIGDKITEESAVVARQAYDMGCEINSHSRTHSDMSEMTAEDIRAEMAYVDEYVYSITGEYPKFFRPPYLNVSDTMYEAIDIPFITGYSSGDSAADATAETIAEKVLSYAKDGAIILMHDYYGNDRTVEALETILPELQSQGYEFVTLTELFDRKVETPEQDFCYSEVQEHPCKDYTFSENLFTGQASGDSSWDGWNSTILLDAQQLEALDSFTIEVAYESTNPPIIVLHRWKSSEDNLWEAVKPAYYNGKKACFRSEDLQAVLDSYGMDYTDMDKIILRTNWTEMTITQADLYVKTAVTSLMGDVDLDSAFSVTDVIAMQKYLLAVPDTKLACWENGDFCPDGILDSFDLCAMKQELLTGGMIE